MCPQPRLDRARRVFYAAASLVLALGTTPISAGGPEQRPRGLCTDRLSRQDLKVWMRIRRIVAAVDRSGRPLHPTLRALWDAVDTSGHVVYVEMRRRKRSCIAGRFAITKVDPEGKTHEAILILNPRVIDELSTGPGAARPDGFIPFEGLGKHERYAELLGHELAHAVWTLADPERARLVMPLQTENEQVMRRVLDRSRASGDELAERVRELVELYRMMEEPAEAAEMAVWRELRMGQRVR